MLNGLRRLHQIADGTTVRWPDQPSAIGRNRLRPTQRLQHFTRNKTAAGNTLNGYTSATVGKIENFSTVTLQECHSSIDTDYAERDTDTTGGLCGDERQW